MGAALAIKPLLEEVQVRLGGSSVAIELIEKDVKVARRVALRDYQRHLPGQGRAVISPATSGKHLINHPGVQGVTHVWFVDRTYVTGDVDPFDPYSVVSPLTGAAGMTFGQLEQELGYREIARRIVSAEPEWHAQYEGNAYYLYLDTPTSPNNYEVGYRYVFHWNADDETLSVANSVLNVPASDDDWITRAVLAHSKQILGRARSKFGGIPNSEGGVDEFDGRELIEESREELRELAEEIKKRRRPLDVLIE